MIEATTRRRRITQGPRPTATGRVGHARISGSSAGSSVCLQRACSWPRAWGECTAGPHTHSSHSHWRHTRASTVSHTEPHTNRHKGTRTRRHTHHQSWLAVATRPAATHMFKQPHIRHPTQSFHFSSGGREGPCRPQKTLWLYSLGSRV